MKYLTEQILEYAARLPQESPITAKSLLHFGNRAAVDQALSRLARRGELLRAGRGIYVRPLKSRFGSRPPRAEGLVQFIASQRGEITTPSGAASANALGLTTQVPVRTVYLTSGRSRKLRLGKQVIELRHAPPWQLVLPNRHAGAAVRALAWLGPREASPALEKLAERLPREEIEALTAVRHSLPTWLAESVSRYVVHG